MRGGGKGEQGLERSRRRCCCCVSGERDNDGRGIADGVGRDGHSRATPLPSQTQQHSTSTSTSSRLASARGINSCTEPESSRKEGIDDAMDVHRALSTELNSVSASR